MPQLSKKHWIIGVTAVVLLAGLGIYKYYKSKFLNVTIPQSVRSESGGLYRISYDTIMIDEVAGSVFITNIKVAADTSQLSSDSATGDQPNMIIELEADSLRISGVETPRALFNKEISGNNLIISGVHLRLLQMESSKDTASDKTPKDSLPADILESIYYDVMKELRVVKMDTIRLDNIDFSLINNKSGKKVIESSNITLTLNDLLIDNTSLRDNSRVFFSRQVSLVADSLVLHDKKGLYDYEFAGLDLNSVDKKIELSSIRIKPLFSESGFAKQFKTQIDRFNFVLKGITLTGIEPANAMQGELKASSLTVRESAIRIYRDGSYPRDGKSKVGQYPHQVITDIPFPLNIAKARFEKTFIEYKEKNPKTGQTGSVQFNRATADIDNITNDKKAIANNNIMAIAFKSSFLNMALVDVKLKLRLGDKQGRFTATGTLGAFDATKLNQLTEPLGMARVERGRVDGISFNMYGDNNSGNGDLMMLYDGLKISTLKMDDDENELKKQGLKSFVANAVVRNKNPAGGNKRKGDMKNERNPERSFFNLVWKTIFAGVKETVGM